MSDIISINIKLPRKVWTRFKALCNIKGTCATKALEAMVTAQVSGVDELLDKLEGIVGEQTESKGNEQLDIENTITGKHSDLLGLPSIEDQEIEEEPTITELYQD